MSVSFWGLELFRELRHLTWGGCNSCPWGAVICLIVVVGLCCGCCGFAAGLLTGSRWLRSLALNILRHLVGPESAIPVGVPSEALSRRFQRRRLDHCFRGPELRQLWVRAIGPDYNRLQVLPRLGAIEQVLDQTRISFKPR